MLLAAKDIFCIQRYEIFHEIPNSGGDFSTNGPEKGFRGRVAAHRGRFPGPQPGEGQRVQRRGTGTGRGFCGGAGAGPARSAARDRAVQVVLRWSPEAEPACSAAQDGGGAGSSAVEPGRGQRVQRWGPVRDGGGTGGGSAAQAGAGPACSAARDRGGTGSSEVQTGRAGRRVAKKVFRREDAPAARVTVLSRRGHSSQPSGVSAVRSPEPSPQPPLLAPSAAGVTAPPRRYGRPPATGESPASSLRRASPARDSTAYRPAP